MKRDRGKGEGLDSVGVESVFPFSEQPEGWRCDLGQVKVYRRSHWRKNYVLV